MDQALLGVLKKYQKLKIELQMEPSKLALCQDIQKLSLITHSLLEDELFKNLGFDVKEAYEYHLEQLPKLMAKYQIRLDHHELVIIKGSEETKLQLLSPKQLAGTISDDLSKDQLELLELYCSEKEVFLGLNFSIQSSNLN